jgi:hypothetical protein
MRSVHRAAPRQTRQRSGAATVVAGRRSAAEHAADQVRKYMKPEIGRLAFLCCNKPPSDSAHRRRNSIYSEGKKIIIFLTMLIWWRWSISKTG